MHICAITSSRLLAQAWGVNNREAALRLIQEDGDRANCELKAVIVFLIQYNGSCNELSCLRHCQLAAIPSFVACGHRSSPCAADACTCNSVSTSSMMPPAHHRVACVSGRRPWTRRQIRTWRSRRSRWRGCWACGEAAGCRIRCR